MHKIGLRSLTILLAFSLIAACGDDDDGGSGDGGDGGSTTSDGGDGGTSGTGGDGTGGDSGGTSTDGGTDDGATGTTGDGGSSTGSGTGGSDCPPEAEDGECLACIKANCCDGLQNCLDDEDCACVLQCLDEGGAGTGTATDTGTGSGGVNCPGLCNGGGNVWPGFSYCVGGFCGEQGEDVCPGA